MDLKKQLEDMERSRKSAVSAHRQSHDRAVRKRSQAERDIKDYHEAIIRAERELVEIDVLRALAKSMEDTRPYLEGIPVLVWVDMTATTIHGPSMTVYPPLKTRADQESKENDAWGDEAFDGDEEEDD